MNKKQKILLIVLSAINLIAGLLLILFAVPNFVPTVLGIKEEIVCTGSKWCLVPALVLPAILAVIAIVFENKNGVSFFAKSLFFFAIYQNVLIFIASAGTKEFAVGSSYAVSLSLLVFVPLSCLILVFGEKLKNQPFNTFPILWKKQATATEFLWKQIHFFAKNVFMSAGLILFVISVVFAFFKLWLIELAIFVIAFITSYLIVFKHASDIFKKYNEMNQKLNQNKSVQEKDKK